MKNKSKSIPALLLALCLTAGLLAVPGTAAAADSPLDADVDAGFVAVANLYVYVDGELDGELSGRFDSGSLAVLSAPEIEGKTFNYWALGSADGPKASYLPTYRLAVNADTTLYAVYGEAAAEAQPAVAITAAVRTQENNGSACMRLTATFSVPEGNQVTDAGIVYLSNSTLGVSPTCDLLKEKVNGLDVEQLLTGGKSDKRLRNLKAENEGLVTSFDDTNWTAAAGTWRLNQADWTLALSVPGNDSPVYVAAFMTVDGETVYSEVFKAVYSELSGIMMKNSTLDEAIEAKLGS